MATSKSKRWSQRVTESSNALDLESQVFKKQDAKEELRKLYHRPARAS